MQQHNPVRTWIENRAVFGIQIGFDRWGRLWLIGGFAVR